MRDVAENVAALASTLRLVRAVCRHLHGLGWQGYVTNYVTISLSKLPPRAGPLRSNVHVRQISCEFRLSPARVGSG
jgi:hypothetical protein